MNYRLFALSLIFLNSYASQDAAVLIEEQSAPTTATNVPRKNFLLAYGELPDIPLPKEIEYLITQHILDEILVPFSFEEPQTSYNIDMKYSSETQLAFSENDSLLALILSTGDKIKLAITQTEPGHEPKVDQLPIENIWSGGCSFNKDGTKLFVTQDSNLNGSKLLEIKLTDTSIEEISGIQEILTKDHKSPEEQLSPLNRLNHASSTNEIKAIARTQQGEIVFCTNNKEVFILNDQHSIYKKITNADNPFILKTSTVDSTNNKTFSTNTFVNISHTSPHVVFLTNNQQVEVCNYATEELTTIELSKETLPDSDHISFSPNGRYLIWKTGKYYSCDNSAIHIYDTIDKVHSKTITLSAELPENVVFLANSNYLLMSSRASGLTIYHSSGRLVALNKMNSRKKELDTLSLSVGSHTGTLFATVTNGKTSNTSVSLFIWKFQPIWKIHSSLFTLKQALLISLILELKGKGLSINDALPDLRRIYQMTSQEISSDLKDTYESSSKLIKEYIMRLLYMSPHNSSSSTTSKAPF